MKVNVKNYGYKTLSEKDFIASGGEASIYHMGNNLVAKIYHNKSKCISEKKILELKKIDNENIILPIDLIYDDSGDLIGYSMRYVKDTIPLCKFFTKSFKNQNNIYEKIILDIIENIKKNIHSVHREKCLVVDLNEMNILVSNDYQNVYFIDTDSFQTPSFPATAIMDHIRDRKVHNNKWTSNSDWFSFAIISFQLMMNIHPYRIGHPDYKINQIDEKMKNNICIFNKNATKPKIANDLSVIPSNYISWYKDLFEHGKRSNPPDSFCDIKNNYVSTKINNAYNSKVLTELLVNYDSNIIDAIFRYGSHYCMTNDGVYKDKSKLPVSNLTDTFYSEFVLIDNKILISEHKNNEIKLFETNGNLLLKEKYNFEKAVFYDNKYYLKNKNILSSIIFKKIGSKYHALVESSLNVMDNSTNVFKGIVFQSLMGKCFANIPYDNNKYSNIFIPELNSYNIIYAERISRVLMLIAYKDGDYYQFIFYFDKNYTQYSYIKNNNVALTSVNFQVLSNGVVVSAEENCIKVFNSKDIKNVLEVQDSPFVSENKLFLENNYINYIDNNKLFRATLKSS